MLSHNENIIYWLWLTGLPTIGTVTIRKIWKHFGDIKRIYMASETELSEVGGIRKSQVNILKECRSMEKAEGILKSCNSYEIRICTVEMKDYPDRCRDLSDIPPLLYYKGSNKINHVKTVGIIGKRRCTETGKNEAIRLAQEKCGEEFGIISGFAKGIDSYAHTAAIKADGYTIGILGNGIDICYPPEQIALKEAIERDGLFISQYPPGTMPQKYTFPIRNKLIAALSDELYVIEKGRISGTQSTVDAAEKYGKTIYLR